MFSDAELKSAGLRALVDALGDVQAEKFVALLLREPFDYTQWHRSLWPATDLEQISREAMKHRDAQSR